jgi:RNA recognition motif-containing protein
VPFFIDPTRIQQVEKLCHKENLVGNILYVGNLTDSATQTNLEEWFAQYGIVHSAHLITDRDTGRSRGFGFVEMDTDAQAQSAIQGLPDHEHDGRRLTVYEAKPGDDRGGSVGGGRSDGGGYGGGGGRPYGFQRKPLSYRP